MPGKVGVTGAVSPPASVNQDGTLTVEERLAKSEAETERLKKAFPSLQAERDQKQARIEELEAIEEKRGLSERQEAERKRLEAGLENIDEEINGLKAKPENKAFFKWIEREIKRAAESGRASGSMDALSELGLTYLEEMAEELSSTKVGDKIPDEFKGLDGEKLWKLIKPHVGQFEKMNPYLKVKKAFKAWKAHQDYLIEKDEISKKKAEAAASGETGTRQAREHSSAKDALDAGDRRSAREKLGIMHGPK